MIATEYHLVGPIEADREHFTDREWDFLWNRVVEKNRPRWVAGRMAAKKAVRKTLAGSGVLGISLRNIEILGTTGTKPIVTIECGSKNANGQELPEKAFPRIDISVAHTGDIGVGAAALSVDDGSVGIDVERVGRFSEVIPEGFLTSKEQTDCENDRTHGKDFLAVLFWCCKEAYLKALGVGLIRSPSKIAVSLENGTNRCMIEETCEARMASGEWVVLRDEYVVVTVTVQSV